MHPALLAANLLLNPSFESGLAGWDPAWARETGAIRAQVLGEEARDGSRMVRLVHSGRKDWSLAQKKTLPAAPGEVWEIAGWVRTKGLDGRVQLGVILRDAGGEVLDWVHGPAETGRDHDWRRLTSRFLVPAGGASVQFRLTGWGPVDLLADGLSLVRLPQPPMTPPPPLVLASPRVALTIDGATGAWTVTADGRMWSQPAGPAGILIEQAERLAATSGRLVLLDPVNDLALTATVTLVADAPEIVVEIGAAPGAAMTRPLRWPAAFASRPGDFVLAPFAEGRLIPVEETAESRGFSYFEWKTSMGFGGVTDLTSGYAVINETPWDSTLDLPVTAGRLALGVSWHGTKGTFGYPRRLVYRFETTGGHVALAKRYRASARARGWIVPFAEKSKIRPAVAKLLGAVDLWMLDRDLPADFLDDLAACGVTKALVSIGGGWKEPGDADGLVRRVEALGWLASRYDIYTDVWNPADKPNRWLRTAGFPEDVIVDADGGFHKGWLDKSPDGPFQGYVLCSSTHRKCARERIGSELARTPYNARFIDVVTAGGLFECYSPAHPTDRRADAAARADMLKLVSDEFKLATGSEEIREFAVPFSDFSEGTMTIRPATNAGYDWGKPADPEPDYLRLNAGAATRVPLFELAFHDCHVSTWYTGDGMTKVPACWDAKDLLNLLYGTMPLWMPNKDLWAKYRTRFLASYHTVNSVFAAVGGAEMTSHEFLREDRLVQRTRFASGHAVTANFGDADWTDTPSGKVLPRHGFVATGPGLDGWRARVDGRVVTRVETPAKVYLDPGGAMWGDRVLRADGPVVLLKDAKGNRVVPLSPATRVERPEPKL